MPSCVIKWCKNNTKVNKKSEGISFHTLPTNILIRDEWVAAIRLSRNDPQWQPSSSSVVCSDHFEETDMYDTKRGLRRIHRTGYPKKKLCPPTNAVVRDILSPNTSPPFVPIFPVSLSVVTHTDSNSIVSPSTSSAAVLKLSPPYNADVSDILSPNTPPPFVSKLSPPSNADVSDRLSPNTPPPFVPILPVSPSVVIDSNCIVLPSTSAVVLKLSPHSNTVVIDIIPSNTWPPFVPILPVSPSVVIDSHCIVLPSTSSAVVLKLSPPSNADDSDILSPNTPPPFAPNLRVSPGVFSDSNCVVLPSTSSAAVFDLPDTPYADVEQESLFDTPRKHKLRQQLKKRELLLKKYLIKIKCLQQKVRRLENRNVSLKKIVKNLKMQNFTDTDLHNSLNQNMAADHSVNNLNRKKAKKKH